MSRPADWSPIAAADPVPGDPQGVAELGARLRQTALDISREVSYLRSLCTDEFWDSDAGRAFRDKVAATSDKLWRSHHRYLEASEAVGWSLTGAGYAAGLDQAQAMAGRALTRGQEAWASMRPALTSVLDASGGKDPFGVAGAFSAQSYLAPLFDGSGNPALMPYLGSDAAAVAALKRQYNGYAGDLAIAIGLLRQATALRDEAAGRAAARIRAAIDHDGLQDAHGFFHDLAHYFDDARGAAAAHWAQILSDVANVLGWLATALGILALVFAFIPGLQPLAAALEGLAFTLTELTLACHLVLAATGHGPWLDVGLDVISLATFGLGRSVLGGAKGTVQIADKLSTTSISAEADSLAARLGEGLNTEKAFTEAVKAADTAVAKAAAQLTDDVPGLLGRLDAASADFLHPVQEVRTAWETATSTAWRELLSGGKLKTFGTAAAQALRFQSPEIGEALKELGQVPEIGRVARISGIPFTTNVVEYGRIWTGSQVSSLTIDAVDKINSVLTHLHSELPGYNPFKEATRS